MQTQLAKLKEFMISGDYRSALRLAAGWSQLGEHRHEIQRGWAALQNPNFYREIGKNPDELVELGLKALRERYTIGD